ncbi:hypothetical protein D3C87_1866850 [compost metagenome]
MVRRSSAFTLGWIRLGWGASPVAEATISSTRAMTLARAAASSKREMVRVPRKVLSGKPSMIWYFSTSALIAL